MFQLTSATYPRPQFWSEARYFFAPFVPLIGITLLICFFDYWWKDAAITSLGLLFVLSYLTRLMQPTILSWGVRPSSWRVYVTTFIIGVVLIAASPALAQATPTAGCSGIFAPIASFFNTAFTSVSATTAGSQACTFFGAVQAALGAAFVLAFIWALVDVGRGGQWTNAMTVPFLVIVGVIGSALIQKMFLGEAKAMDASNEPKNLTVNSIVGKAYGVGIIPASQLSFWVIALTLGLLVWLLYDFRLNAFGIFLFVTILPCAVFWGLTGNKPYRFFETLHRPRKWLRGNPTVEWSQSHPVPHKPYLGKRRVVHSSTDAMKIQVFHALEDSLPLVCYGRVELQGSCGFSLTCDRARRSYRTIWGWESVGIDPNLSEAEAALRAQKLDQALRRFPEGLTLRVENTSFADDSDYQEILDRHLERTDNPLLDLLLYSEKRQARNLANGGKRQQQKIRIFAIFEAQFEEAGAVGRNDWLEKLMGGLSSSWESFAKGSSAPEVTHFQEMLLKAYHGHFQHVDSLLNTVMKLGAKPLSAQALFESDYAELHREAAPPLPQLLVLDRDGLYCEANDPFTHVTAYLTRPERGSRAVPHTGRSWIYLPAKDKYAGVMQLGKPTTFPVAEDGGPYRGQLQYLFKPCVENGLHDYKIVTEIARANQGMQNWDLQRHTRNAHAQGERAVRSGTVDTASHRRSDDSIAARECLDNGEIVVSVASCLWLYRNNPAALDADFGRVAKFFPTAECERSHDVTEDFWLQLFPFTWDRLLTRPYNRLQYMLSREVVGMLPLILPQAFDQSGIPFLSREGGTPVWVDIIDQLQHLFICATSRAGKSVLLAFIIFLYLLNKMPLVIYDFPRPTDGTSTFFDFVKLIRRLGGSAFYYDVASQSNNLIGFSDVRGLPKAKERRKAQLDFHVEAISTIILGDVRDELLEAEVQSLVRQSYKDFQKHPDISDRYLASFGAPLGSEAYNHVPTLWDYLNHVVPWLKRYLEENALLVSEKTQEAASFIVSQLRGVLHSELEPAIARPSSFEGDPDLLVIALTNVSSNRTAAILGMSGYSLLLRKALEHRACGCIIDESPVMFDFKSFSARVAHMASNGLKWGCRLTISAQTAAKIFKSGHGEQIFETIFTRMAGYITNEGVNSLEHYLGFDRRMLEKYQIEAFKPNKKEMRSHWLIKNGDKYFEVDFIPSEVLLALAANNPNEQAARDRVMAQFDDPVEGLAHFASLYAHALREGIPMEQIAPNSTDTQAFQKTSEIASCERTNLYAVNYERKR